VLEIHLDYLTYEKEILKIISHKIRGIPLIIEQTLGFLETPTFTPKTLTL
jgi:hypothetical protein